MSDEGELLIAKLRIALAEEGYQDAPMWEDGIRLDGERPHIQTSLWVVPDDVWWRAYSVVAPPVPCWTCWTSGDVLDREKAKSCIEGDCQASPTEPKVPPRRVRAAS